MALNSIKVILRAPNGQERQLWSQAGKRLWDIIADGNWACPGSCGGQGTCGKCKVKVEGQLSPMSSGEREQLMPDELRSSYRLACKARVEGDVIIYLDHPLTEAAGKAWQFGSTHPIIQNGIRNLPLLIAGQPMQTSLPLLDRLVEALPEGVRLNISMDNLRDLHSVDRPNRPALELQALLMEQEIRYIVPHRQVDRLVGLALDLGSTSLLGLLVDLENGEVLGVCSQTNMQRIYGEDIISRISYCSDQADGAAQLHRLLINQINSMMAELLPTAGEQASIIKLTAVGNPVMLHFLLGLPGDGFARAPYSGLFSVALDYSAAELGLELDPLARLYIPAQLGGLVGADVSAALLCLPESPATADLLIDIGTNGEIVLRCAGRYWAASAAAGPAFEGAGITCGTRAVSGAIDHCYLQDGEVCFSSIGDGPVKGFCGSGLIELLALLRQIEGIDHHGIIQSNSYFIRDEEEPGGRLILLSAAVNEGQELWINQEDIRRLQLAKSAIRTAIELLLKNAEVEVQQLEQVYLAGVFGSCISAEAAVQIGLLPEISPTRIVNIGNVAALGALQLLLEDQQRKRTDEFRRRTDVVELAEQQEFEQLFLQYIDFPELA